MSENSGESKMFIEVEEMSKLKDSSAYMAAAGEKIDAAVKEFSDIYSTLDQGHYKLFCETSGKGLYDGYEIRFTVPKVENVNEVIATVMENVDAFENKEPDLPADPDTKPQPKKDVQEDIPKDTDGDTTTDGEEEIKDDKRKTLEKEKDDGITTNDKTQKPGQDPNSKDIFNKESYVPEDTKENEKVPIVNPNTNPDLPTLDDILSTPKQDDKNIPNNNIITNDNNNTPGINGNNGDISFKNKGSNNGTILKTAAGVGGVALGAGASYAGIAGSSGSVGPDFLGTTDIASGLDDKYAYTSVDPVIENPAMDSGIIPTKNDDDDDKKKIKVTPTSNDETEIINLAGENEESNIPEEPTTMKSNTANLNTVIGLGGISAALGVGGVFLANEVKEKKEEKEKEKQKNNTDNDLDNLFK